MLALVVVVLLLLVVVSDSHSSFTNAIASARTSTFSTSTIASMTMSELALLLVQKNYLGSLSSLSSAPLLTPRLFVDIG